jgi:4-aminobutyrate aminotransferase-like enzyme
MLEDVLRYQSTGEVAAFIAEPMLGSAGNIPAPEGYFKEIKKILDKNGILFIADEVITGFGRTGKMFAIQHYGVRPDIMTMAKALGGGVPISAVMTTEDVARNLEPMDYFATYGGNPLVCAAAIGAIEAILEEGLVERSKKLGDYFMKRLKEIEGRHKLIGEIRGSGLLIGIELVKDKKTKEPAVEESMRLREEARNKGVILAAGWGWLGNVIRISPPLVITKEQIDKSVEVIDKSLKQAAKT